MQKVIIETSLKEILENIGEEGRKAVNYDEAYHDMGDRIVYYLDLIKGGKITLKHK